jgi:hopanoid C-2 methylase
MGTVKAFMPPQDIRLIAALFPPHWEVRFIDENIRPATEKDLRPAEVVFTTGRHIQRKQIQDLIARAHRAGKPVVPGGPSASSAPE